MNIYNLNFKILVLSWYVQLLFVKNTEILKHLNGWWLQ